MQPRPQGAGETLTKNLTGTEGGQGPVKAVIMAGGQGSRLRPLTCDKPKPMMPIVNRPMMEYIIELLAKHSITDIAVTTCYLPEVIEDYFGDGAAWGVRLHYYREETPLGTAGSVKNAADFLNEPFIVISGDALTDFDLQAAVTYHREKRALATLVLTRVESPLEYGVVFTNDQGRIERFLEKPAWGQVFSDTVNTGIYVLEPEVLSYIPAHIQFDFSKDLFPVLLHNQAPLYGYVATGYWSDIGNLEQYRQAHYDVLDKKVTVKLPGIIQDGIWVERGVSIHPEAIVESPAVLGRGCRVERHAHIGPYTVVGANSFVGRESSCKRAILWNNVHVDTGVELRGTVVCDHATFQARARAFEAAVIGKGTVVSSSATVRPGVKVWPEKQVEQGAIVGSNLVWSASCSRSLFGNRGISGLVNLEITPEFAARVGAATGAILEPHREVVVASDGWAAARMIKRAVISGLLSGGIDVTDVGSASAPVTRWATGTSTAVAGVYICQGIKSLEHLEVHIFDEDGVPLGRSRERSIEHQFFREDFRRARPDAVGHLRFLAGASTRYLAALMTTVEAEAVRQQGLRVAVGYTSEVMHLLLPALLEGLGCQVMDIGLHQQEGISPAAVVHEPDRYLKQLAGRVLEDRFDLGFLIDGSGEQVFIVDERGRKVREDLHWPLISRVLMAHGDGASQLAVPVTAPHNVEYLAQERQRSVMRTSADSRSILTVYKDREDPMATALVILHPAFDGLSFMMHLLALLAEENCSLSQLVQNLSPPQRYTGEIPCPWQKKGKVMRSLLEHTIGQPRDLIDGIKVYHGDSWALVLPDADEPLFRVYSEAATEEEADALARLYMTRILEIQRS